MTKTIVTRAPSAPVSLFPNESEWAMLKEQANMVVKTNLLPRGIDTAEKAIAVALKGREMGIPPMHAYAHIHIIQGKPTMSAELMLAMIYKNCPGAVINYLESTAKICRIEAKRPGHKASTFSYTIEEAQKAGLLNKDSWKNYPSAMLRARTLAIVARAQFADAIMGVSYTPEELGAEVDEDGETIDVTPNKDSDTEQAKTEAPATKPPAAEQEKPKVVVKPLELKVETPPPAKTPKQLGGEIMQLAYSMNMKDVEVMQWMTDHFKKDPKTLTREELVEFLEILQREQGFRGDAHE